MSDPVVQQHIDPQGPRQDYAWVEAYMLLRHIAMDRRDSAAPRNTLSGAIEVIEDQLARKLEVPLRELKALIKADHDKFYEPKDGKDRADRAVNPI